MSHKTYSPEVEDEIIRLYQSGVPSSSINDRFGGQPYNIRALLKRRGIPRAPTGRRPWRHFTNEEVAEMARMWREDSASQTAIANRFDTAQIVVSRVLRANGIEPVARHGQKSGKKHHSWRGGRIGAAGGYTAVWVDPSDPMASMRNRMGYVLEHRLVMARALGRPLEKWETVHHIDGNRLNNEPGNLQLRQGRHGNGTVMACLDCGSHRIGPVPIAEQPSMADAY